jgi:hypothetical protein
MQRRKWDANTKEGCGVNPSRQSATSTTSANRRITNGATSFWHLEPIMGRLKTHGSLIFRPVPNIAL